MLIFLIEGILFGLTVFAVIFEIIAATSGFHLKMMCFAMMATGCGIMLTTLRGHCPVFMGIPLIAATCFVLASIIFKMIP